MKPLRLPDGQRYELAVTGLARAKSLLWLEWHREEYSAPMLLDGLRYLAAGWSDVRSVRVLTRGAPRVRLGGPQVSGVMAGSVVEVRVSRRYKPRQDRYVPRAEWDGLSLLPLTWAECFSSARTSETMRALAACAPTGADRDRALVSADYLEKRGQ